MDEKQIDKKRRNFLKILALGGGAVMLGRIFGGGVFNFFGATDTTNGFKNFKVSQKNNQLTISSKNGEPLFIVDNEA